MSERLASEILKIAREVLAIGQHKKPVKYDHGLFFGSRNLALTVNYHRLTPMACEE